MPGYHPFPKGFAWEETDMPRTARRASESGFYHVMARGASRQLVFEDDADRRAFLALLSKGCGDCGVSLLAYVLMDNHFHLLVEGSLETLSSCMKSVTGTYASQFNGRHGRCGHLFQGRFKSEPIDDDKYLLSVVRYIHKNPEIAGLGAASEWPWSSYREYVGETSLIDPKLVLGMLGGVEGFVEFHALPCVGREPADFDERETGGRLSDEEALRVACDLLGGVSPGSLSGLARGERDEALAKLRGAGLGVRQIQRLTGISLGSISKARPMERSE